MSPVVLWPCRIVTPSGTYDPAHFSFGDGEAVSILDKQGAVVAMMPLASRTLAAEGAQTGKGNVTQQWRVEGADRWLVELTTGCGCGGTVTRETDPTELQW